MELLTIVISFVMVLRFNTKDKNDVRFLRIIGSIGWLIVLFDNLNRLF